jgi:hypothetical protein
MGLARQVERQRNQDSEDNPAYGRHAADQRYLGFVGTEAYGQADQVIIVERKGCKLGGAQHTADQGRRRPPPPQVDRRYDVEQAGRPEYVHRREPDKDILGEV